ncbi:hypothetical protein IC575_004982 [Cucumis melo]
MALPNRMCGKENLRCNQLQNVQESSIYSIRKQMSSFLLLCNQETDQVGSCCLLWLIQNPFHTPWLETTTRNL